MKQYRFLKSIVRQRRLWLFAVLVGICVALVQPTFELERGLKGLDTQERDFGVPHASVTAQVRQRVVPTQPAGPQVRPGYEYVSRPAALKFEETLPGLYEVKGPKYRASLSDADGLTYMPKVDERLLQTKPSCEAYPLALDEKNTTLSEASHFRVRLDRIRCGGRVHYDRALEPAEDVAVHDESGGISFWRAAGIEECFQARGDGVEQVFKLEQRLEGEGELEFACSVELKNLKVIPARQDLNGGILFQNAFGHTALKYGQVVVRDSAKNGCVVEPRLNTKGDQIVFSVPEGFLKRAVYPVEVDPLVGSDFYISDNLPTSISQPTIEASSASFLVVWSDYRSGTTIPQVVASLVTPTGLASPNFLLSNLAGVPQPYRNQRVSVASDGTNWLVVWSDDRGVGAGIRGALVLPSGAVLDGDDFFIAPTSGVVKEDPIVTFNGFEFVVAWTDSPPAGGTSQVFYTRVTSAKVVGTSALVPTTFLPANQSLYFLAPQKPSGDTLLIYRENNESPAATRSVRIATDSSIKDAGGTVLFKELQTESGFGRAIGATFTGGEWQILSTFDHLTDSSIYLHRLSTTGTLTPPSGVFAEMGLGATGDTSEAYAPAFAGANEWLFLRNKKISNALYHIIGKRVTYAGVDRDPIPFQVDTSTQGILRDAVAAQIGDRFLAVWLDGRSGGAQPGDSRDVAGAIIDTTIAGSTDTALVAVASGSPTSGEAPLTVGFDSGLSKGSYDTLVWDFGDGTTGDTPTVSKIYSKNGIYFATLYLTKAGYTVSDRIVISVGSGGGPTTGGTKIGSPVQNSAGMETNLFVGSALVRLNFAATGQDVARVTGVVDAGLLPTDLTGKTATVTIGNFTTTVSLDAKGQYKSETINFGVNNVTGAFSFVAITADIQTLMEPLGLTNTDIKPARPIELTVTMTVGDTFTGSAKVSTDYKSIHNDVGAANYIFLDAGKEVSGSFVITSFSATEELQAKTGLKVHTFSIKGRVVQPNGELFLPAPTGSLDFLIGNYSVGVPVGQFAATGGKLKFVARAGISGLKKFSIDFNSGLFNMQLLKVPAEAEGGSGLYVAKTGDDITKVDLNLSFSFDLKSGKFSAGRYLFISRKDLKAKGWKLR